MTLKVRAFRLVRACFDNGFVFVPCASQEVQDQDTGWVWGKGESLFMRDARLPFETLFRRNEKVKGRNDKQALRMHELLILDQKRDTTVKNEA